VNGGKEGAVEEEEGGVGGGEGEGEGGSPGSPLCDVDPAVMALLCGMFGSEYVSVWEEGMVCISVDGHTAMLDPATMVSAGYVNRCVRLPLWGHQQRDDPQPARVSGSSGLVKGCTKYRYIYIHGGNV